MRTLQVDPEFSQAIPPLLPEEFAQLEANLLVEGCRDPLVIWQEMQILLDGHNRYILCIKHGLPFTTKALSFPDRNAAMNWMDTNQLGRRNLAPDQASLLRGRIYNRTKKQEGGQEGNTNAEKRLPQFEGVVSESTAANLAQQYGVSRSTIERDGAFAHAVDQLQPMVPDIARQVLTRQAPPKSAVIEAATLLETNPDKAEAILKGDLRMADVKRQQRREARLARVAEQTQDPGDLLSLGRFAVLYADPPWEYEYVTSDSRAIENHYPTMSLEAICQMPIAELTYADAVLFLWATSPKLLEALQVMTAWGFTYRTCAVWDKERIGMGYYFRQQHELLLVGARGTLPVPDEANRPASVLRIPRPEIHSAKPAEVYAMIELMYPGLRKLELFARGQQRNDWSVWGNQA